MSTATGHIETVAVLARADTASATGHGQTWPDMKGVPATTVGTVPLPDPTHLDLTDVDLRRLLESDEARRAASIARDALYVTVGLGVLGVQRTQVRRREIERSLRRARVGPTDR